jgi:hypothetical protein
MKTKENSSDIWVENVCHKVMNFQTKINENSGKFHENFMISLMSFSLQNLSKNFKKIVEKSSKNKSNDSVDRLVNFKSNLKT